MCFGLHRMFALALPKCFLQHSSHTLTDVYKVIVVLKPNEFLENILECFRTNGKQICEVD